MSGCWVLSCLIHIVNTIVNTIKYRAFQHKKYCYFLMIFSHFQCLTQLIEPASVFVEIHICGHTPRKTYDTWCYIKSHYTINMIYHIWTCYTIYCTDGKFIQQYSTCSYKPYSARPFGLARFFFSSQRTEAKKELCLLAGRAYHRYPDEIPLVLNRSTHCDI